jgi:hypothetical protein
MTEEQQGRSTDHSAADNGTSAAEAMKPGEKLYQIHVTGQLDSRWSDWLEGFELQLLENGEMLLTGIIADQAALMGILNKLNRLNLPLVSDNLVKKEEKRQL